MQVDWKQHLRTTIVNKEKFLNVRYLSGYKQAGLAVINPRFAQLNEISEDIYETELYKTGINMDIPVQIGFAILNYAKLFLLKFYYDFLLKFVGRENLNIWKLIRIVAISR